MPLVFSEAQPVEPIATPDLASLDRAVETSAPGARASFAPRDLT
jgi:hypothetical protein